MNKLLYKDLSYKIQGSFFEVYKSLGNAFKEGVYHNALIEQLKSMGLKVDSQKRISIYYRDKKVGVYVPDLVVDESVMIEIKCKPFLIQNDVKQFWYYLKGSEYRLGYLVNFGSAGKVQFIRRVYDTARKVSRDFA